MTESSTSRKPHPAYRGRNGFTENASLRDDGSADDILLRRHRLAQYVLSEKGTFAPTLEEMKAAHSCMDTLAHVKERIKELKLKYVRDMERFFAFKAQEYAGERFDIYLSKDDTQYLEEGETDPTIVASYAHMNKVYEEALKLGHFKRDWMDAIENLRYSHLRTLLPLLHRKAEMEARDREYRRRFFPTSAEDFRKITRREVQSRIARFLPLPTPQKDAKLTEYGWAWRQVQPLIDVYEKDEEFKAEIEKLNRDMISTDPRKRPPVQPQSTQLTSMDTGW